jgi:hypothetical protein
MEAMNKWRQLGTKFEEIYYSECFNDLDYDRRIRFYQELQKEVHNEQISQESTIQNYLTDLIYFCVSNSCLAKSEWITDKHKTVNNSTANSKSNNKPKPTQPGNTIDVATNTINDSVSITIQENTPSTTTSNTAATTNTATIPSTNAATTATTTQPIQTSDNQSKDDTYIENLAAIHAIIGDLKEQIKNEKKMETDDDIPMADDIYLDNQHIRNYIGNYIGNLQQNKHLRKHK